MNKFLSALTVGLIAGSLSMGVMAADAAKPADAASKAPSATVVKKDSGVKSSLKKLLPSAKKESK